MDLWTLEKKGYDPGSAVDDGNRFLIANGYMGVRGTVSEADASAFPAVNLAGVYDRNGDRWREPVNAPSGLFLRVAFNGEPMTLPERTPKSHRLCIDYRHGVFSRDTDFGSVRLRGERIASLASPHLLVERVSLTFREDGTGEIVTGISTDIWDINGPHLFDFVFETEDVLGCRAVTGEKGIPVAVAQAAVRDFEARETFAREGNGVFRTLHFSARAGQTLTLSLFAAVFTGLDGNDPAQAAKTLCREAGGTGADACFAENGAAWDRVWDRCRVDLDGSDEAALALHASQYYLNSIAPRHADGLSIPARGLSGQTYKGAIFWDSEIFLFPMFVHTQPEIAKSLLRYRIRSLPGARQKAAEYGCRGAFYAWESQEGGREGCTDFNVVDVFTHRPVRTYFRDKQIHISADVAYAMMQYYEITGDRSLLEEGGAEVLLACARFYLSRMTRPFDRDEGDLLDVIGPDEYHERVANNAFTNCMARYCLKSALRLREIFADEPAYLAALTESLDYETDWALLPEALRSLRAPRVRDGVLEQFDGYFSLEDCTLDEVRSRLRDPREYWGGDHGVAGTTQIIKQADVIALMALLPEAFTDKAVAENFAYYEPRTEHGSSLSACMYALTACRVGRLDEAWSLFQKTASIDLVGGGKQWAGEVYIGGTHPASNGGTWMIAVLGFAGLRLRGGRIELSPRLPKQIDRIRFRLTVNGAIQEVTVTHSGYSIKKI